ncbi:ATP-NAD kinase family protein [Flocculibacter collagenilyticus]|uniref:ATP-NAD kinase family protein n=1 Tax=Flocculibacter collagenilyticus TaxID=2744479 RepID=UPI0018F46F36|nr:ATP-NAD kinase family protein [Flocculibacter collagenilyticus]
MNETATRKYKLGLIINPVAGVGGSVGLKGSDGEETVEKALLLGAKPLANHRAETALSVLSSLKQQIEIYTVNGNMGAETAEKLGFDTHIVYQTASDKTTANDTEAAVAALLAQNVDLILFTGGDGTARNVCNVMDEVTPVLGIPAGCKIHSGVYAITPKAAGRVVEMLMQGELVTLSLADVMDIDEDAFRQGIVRARRYGEMLTVSELQYVQAVKMGGKESDELVLADIAAQVIDQMDDDSYYVVGSGSTTQAIMDEMGLPSTLLGVDVVFQQELVASDVTAKQLLEFAQQKPTKLIITLIGGQGHIFGRGNQQLSPAFIKYIGKENITVVCTKSKLTGLGGRALISDTGDSDLDHCLSGLIKVTTGYNDMVMYPVRTVN